MSVVARLDQYASILAGEFDDYSMSENLLTYSEQFNDASWVKFNVGVTTNTSSTTAPDGNANSELMTRTTTSPAYFLKGYTKAASSITYTASAFAKKSVGNFCALTTQGTYPSRAAVVFDINSGTISTAAIAYGSFTNASASITSYPNGWYRISLTATSDTATVYDTYFSFNSNGGEIDYTDSASNSAGFIWGAQLERGSVATDYTPTTTTTISRVLPATTNTNITGLGTYYSSEFSENVGIVTTNAANVFAAYDQISGEFADTLYGPGKGTYMRQNTDKSVIVYNEIDEITTIY